MKILISGSSGLIGSALVPFLRLQGHVVYRLIRKKEQCLENTIIWDSETGETNIQQWEKFDALINLSGENIFSGRWTEDKKQRIKESRILTTAMLAEKISELNSPPKVWVNASAIGYYGNQGDNVVTEANPPGSGFLSEVCQEWENATLLPEKMNTRVIKSRFGIVLTNRGGALKEMLLPFKLGLGGIIGSGKQYMSWISLNDLLQAFIFFLSHSSLQGPVNVCSPYPVTNEEFTKTLGKLLHRPTIMKMPSSVAKIVFGKEKAEEMLLSSVRAIPQRLIETGYAFRHPRLEDALKNYLV